MRFDVLNAEGDFNYFDLGIPMQIWSFVKILMSSGFQMNYVELWRNRVQNESWSLKNYIYYIFSISRQGMQYRVGNFFAKLPLDDNHIFWFLRSM